MSNSKLSKITAQVAVEAIITNPQDYDRLVALTVWEDAMAAGVSAFYLDALVQVSPEDPQQAKKFLS